MIVWPGLEKMGISMGEETGVCGGIEGVECRMLVKGEVSDFYAGGFGL